MCSQWHQIIFLKAVWPNFKIRNYMIYLSRVIILLNPENTRSTSALEMGITMQISMILRKFAMFSCVFFAKTCCQHFSGEVAAQNLTMYPWVVSTSTAKKYAKLKINHYWSHKHVILQTLDSSYQTLGK